MERGTEGGGEKRLEAPNGGVKGNWYYLGMTKNVGPYRSQILPQFLKGPTDLLVDEMQQKLDKVFYIPSHP